VTEETVDNASRVHDARYYGILAMSAFYSPPNGAKSSSFQL